ncbi:DUF2750 domain-containing protein [Mannheimia massilioguelmaensis]|uniref:DUF2750 domain-containing protein n=1 Tax=Mannheimia massilioguelmaensis TaxID=1604354 RepID=UPI0005CB7319|nr:DUF2750 domain-containing protein [Mannheimia massilioguelmaensis]
MDFKELTKKLKHENTNEKYDFLLKRMVSLDHIWFLDNEGELVLYKDDAGKPFVPLWSDEKLAQLTPPKNSKIKAVEMDIETFILQFSFFLFNSQTNVAVSPLPSDTEMLVQNSLAFTRDLIETIRADVSEEKAVFYLQEVKKLLT